MKIHKITNFVIIALVITAVYQTEKLWLKETSSHNFFDMFIEGRMEEGEETDGDVLLSTRYAIGEGDGSYSVYYPDKTGRSLFLDETNVVLNEILSDREVKIDKVPADWKEILDNPCIVLQYDFMVNGQEYLSHYQNLKNGEMLDYFDYITIVPSKRPGEESLAYFVNSETNESVCYNTNKSHTASNFYNRLVRSEGDMTYISTGQKTGASVIWRNLFLPQWAELPYEYPSLSEIAVFEKDGIVSHVELERVVKGFFRNFSVDWNDRNEAGNFIFSDNETVVEYLPKERVLEYYNYSSYGDNIKSTGLLEGYQISCNFLSNDSSLNTDVYLADIQKKSDEVIYYFNYVVNDLPIAFCKDIKDQIGGEYAIEIRVKNGSVKNYRRYMVNYIENQENTKKLNVQFIDALEDANKTYQTLVEEKVITDVTDISLEYYVDSSTNIGLKWFVTLYEYLFVTETYRDVETQ